MDKIKVGIIGVSGYGGGELARLLAAHAHVELVYVTSHTYAGQPLYTALPGIRRDLNLVCEEFDQVIAADKCDLLFLAGESGMAMKIAPGLLEAGKKLIDLSADFRLKDDKAYPEWYKMEHTAKKWLDKAEYGLPELGSYRKDAELVANPGCYATSAILALAPLVGQYVDGQSLIIDSYSGVSGAGRSKFGLDYHFSEVNESLRPYGVGGIHRHTPEIEQELVSEAGETITVTFTPHLAPITRGILTTAYATLNKEISLEVLHEHYLRFYQSAPFVVVLELGQFPATKHVQGTNYCHIGLALDKRTNRVIVISAIDNLIKGTAGQAIQNMNLMCGFDETSGLLMSAMWP